jgi:hypothetical protein
MNVTHSPLPWKHYAEDNIICPSNGTGRILEWTPRSANVSVAERDANAAFIVKAVNAHDPMLAALKAANQFCGSLTAEECPDTVHVLIRKALAAAGEQV